MLRRGYTLIITSVVALAGLALLLLALGWAAPVSQAAPLQQAPSNDDFGDALGIPTMPYGDTQNTSLATSQANDPRFPCIANGPTTNWRRGWHSVWYVYTATVNGTLHVDTIGSDYDTVLGVWTGTWGSLTNVGCNDDISWPSNPQSSLDTSVVSGTIYYIEVVGYRSTSSGNMVISADLIVPPANDDFDDAFVISATPYTYTQDTSLATTAADDPVYQSCGTGSGGRHSHSVWYRFTPPVNGDLHLDTAGSDYDTVLAVWTGSRGSLSIEACDDDSGPGTQSSLDLTVIADTAYHIEVVSYRNTTGGSLEIHAVYTPSLKMEVGTVSVDSNWVTVNLGNTYDDMVVVCSLQNDEASPPLVTRIQDAQGSSFQVRLQAAGTGMVPVRTVHYMVMETGAYTLPNGIHIEAQKYTSTVTSGRGSWAPELQTYMQSYTSPVVIGQVMSYNDSDWSVFWQQGSNRADPPSSTTLGTGKMVSKDTDTTRADEVIGFIVIERGHDELFGVAYEAWVGSDSVAGMDNSPPYGYTFQQPFTTTPAVALVAQAGEDGGDGGWAVLYGDAPLTANSMDLAVDEDNIGGNRSHTTEQVSYLVFEKPLVIGGKPFLEISKQVSPVGTTGLILPGDALVYTVDYVNNGLMAATGVLITDQLPTHAIFADTDPGCVHDGSPTSGVVTCTVGTLGAAESSAAAITVTVDSNLTENAILTNTVTIGSAERVSATASITTSVTASSVLKMETLTATANYTWTTVNLNNTYNDVVVICTPNYVPAHNSRPLVTRVRNASGASFEVRLQNPGDSYTSAPETVHCLAMEAGKFTLPDGRKIEAQKYNATVTDENNSWVGEAQSYLHTYANPVIVGQVMSANDSRWSVFWDRGSSQTDPPSPFALYTGKTVCEDTDTARSDETVGFVVVERGNGTIGTVAYEAWLGGDTVQGVADSPPYLYNFNQSFDSIPGVALVSSAAMDGGNGGWAVLYGANPLSPNSIGLAIDEDQIGDSERNHTTEQVAYLVFEEPLVIRPTHDLHISKVDSPDPATAGSTLTYTVSYTNAGILTTTQVVITETYDGNVDFASASPPPDMGDNVWQVGDVGPGVSGALVITVTVDGGIPDWTTLTNTVTIDSDQTYPITDTETTLARAFALSLVKSATPASVMVGDTLVYTITYGNTSVLTLTNVSITETYDSDVNYVSASPLPDVGDNVWHIGDLGAGESGDVIITTTVAGGTVSLLNQAEIGCDQGVSATVRISTPIVSLLKMEVFTTSVDHTWTTVSLSNTYNSMVVICTPQCANNSVPFVTRVRNAAGSGFQLRLQEADLLNPDVTLNPETVHCLVAEEGPAAMPGGRRVEAWKYNSTVTDNDGSWVGEVQTYTQSYANPVILGQVMSYNDSDWSVFWARGPSRTDPPDADDLYTGKTVCEDWDTTRDNETIGFFVIEQGQGTVFGVDYEAWLGTDTVQGMDNSPPYSYSFNRPFNTPPQVALASQAAMDGSNGAWALLYGADPLSMTSIDLALDEDQIGDSERWHTTEQVAYLVFEAPLVLRPTHDLALSKEDGTDPVSVGNTLVYTLSYVNSGVVPATGIVITETYDSNVEFVSANPSPDPGYDNQWTIGSLEWGESGTIVITVTVNTGLTDNTILTNTVTIGSDQTTPVAQSETTLVRSPVLNLTKSDSPDPVMVGSNLVYTITYRNTGVVTATNVVITETYDSNVSFNTANPSPGAGNNVWNVGTLGTGASGDIVITVTVNGGTSLTNVVTMDSDQTAPITASATTMVGAAPTLHLAKSDNPDPVLLGNDLVYNVTYWNSGFGDATGVVITETYDSNVEFVSANPSPDNPGSGDNVWHVADLAPGESRAIEITVTVNGGTTLFNQAEIDCDQDASASDTELTTVVISGQITLDKSVSPDRFEWPGELETYEYAITINNAGPSTVTVHQISDTLPTGFTFITNTATSGIPNPDSTEVSRQDITWSYDPTYPSISAGSSVSLTFAVTSTNEAGLYCNRAGVTIGGDIGVVARDNLACVTIAEPVYEIETRAGDVTLLVRVRLDNGKPVILSWEILR
ncbi:MAG: hypothetical protein ACE5OS_03060 [Anaerolineae bacterium]